MLFWLVNYILARNHEYLISGQCVDRDKKPTGSLRPHSVSGDMSLLITHNPSR